jgi:hypothetical protein
LDGNKSYKEISKITDRLLAVNIQLTHSKKIFPVRFSHRKKNIHNKNSVITRIVSIVVLTILLSVPFSSLASITSSIHPDRNEIKQNPTGTYSKNDGNCSKALEKNLDENRSDKKMPSGSNSKHQKNPVINETNTSMMNSTQTSTTNQTIHDNFTTSEGIALADHADLRASSIEAIKAEHLDQNKTFLANITEDIIARDGAWSDPICHREYVRVEFESALNASSDITIVARSQGQSTIEVYTKDNTTLITTFQNITREHRYQVFLTNLTDSQLIFDLRTSGDPVEYDYIVDPTTGWVSPIGYADPSGQWSTETNAYDDNTGTYAAHSGAVGWRGYLQLNISSAIYCDRVRVYSDFDTYYVDKVSIDIYNSTSWIEKYNGTISDSAWSEVEFSGETTVTKARFRYHYIRGSVIFWFYEFDFWLGKPHTLPNGTTLNATSVDETTAVLKGNVTDDGGEPCEYRFQYGLNMSYGTNTSWGGSEPQNAEFGTMIHNLTQGNTFQYRVQLRNDIGTINGSNKNFTTALPSLGWVTPTSHYDPNSKWNYEIKSYDDETDTCAQSNHAIGDPQWGYFIYMNHSLLICDKVRFYARGPTADAAKVDQVDLDVKRGGVWVDIFNGTFSDKQWVEKKFTQGSVISARIRFHINSVNSGLYYELYELDFNKSRPVPMIINEGPTNRSWGVALRPQMNITVSNPDGASMTISWSSNSSGSWQLFGVNSSVSNGTYHQRNNNFSSNSTRYWWKVIVIDGTDTNASVYYFSTPDYVKPLSAVTAITPYWKKSSPLTITATASDTGGSGLKNVSLYYYNSSNNNTWYGPWKFSVVATPWSGISWSFTFPKGVGYYRFYSVAVDNASNVETFTGNDTRAGYDSVAPTSSADTISVYWKKTSPLTITATASDGLSGVKNVTLYYRFSGTNTSWGGWVNAGVDTAAPWSWSVSFSNGTGYYQFYSIAKDNATNVESAPGSSDAKCGYDSVASTSSVSTVSPYWTTTQPQIITVIASDTGGSGLKNVTIYYYNSTNNNTWKGPWKFGTTNTTPWITPLRCSFTFPNGTGYYRFYSVAYDNATNKESFTGNDTACGYDITAPSSSVDAIAPYWKNSSPLGVVATASDAFSGVKNVTLYYRYSSTNASWGGYVTAGVDTASPWSWSFSFSNGSGYYQFYSIARDNVTNVESAPGSADTFWGYDAGAPTSSVDAVLLYWQKTSPLTINASGSDGLSGVKNVTLYYRFSSNNASWGGYINAGVDTASPWSWSFIFLNGTGYYQFYSIAKDNATNIESAPGSADTSCGYDNVAPTSSLNAFALYWRISSPLAISATASDALSGVKNVIFYYRFSGDNSSWGGWVSAGVDSASPWNWSFGFTNGSGYYQFYSVAKDNATNIESAPGSADTQCGYDVTAPSSSVTTILPYWKNTGVTVTATVSDITSGVKNVTLYYRFSSYNASWDGWVNGGVDSASPWSWSFSFLNGTGYYQIYSIAKDNATNTESAPGSADANCGYDATAPSSSVDTITSYWKKTATTITATANDTLSGVKNVTLYYRFCSDNASWGGWVNAGTDAGSPWSWSFGFLNGSGFYQFYSIAVDHATNTEAAPGSADSWCGYETLIPSSSIDAISGYWKTSSPLTITASANDSGMSGLRNVTLYYRYREANASSWGSYISFVVDPDPWDTCSWDFTFQNGSGHYEFYSIAVDNATNTEAAPGVNGDTECGFSNGVPFSQVNTISPYWTSVIPLSINATADDNGPSGLQTVTLYYYHSLDNMTWSGPWEFGSDDDPWIACGWDFTFPNETGWYRFYSIALDNSSSKESPPLINDSYCGFDDQSPSCTITYNRSAIFFKSNDSVRINADFSEIHSGINESSVLIRIETMGDGDLANHSMTMIDDTHGYYDWIIPDGSDDDGVFTVSLYASDRVYNLLSPYPTVDSSKEIDNTPPSISSVSVGDINCSTAIVDWETNEVASTTVEYGYTSSYGYGSSIPGYVTLHSCFLTGLSSYNTYHYRVVSYDRAGNRNASSDYTFVTAREPPSSKTITYTEQNNPPSSPTISGPITGRQATEYTYRVQSIDFDNDTMNYTFDWGDAVIESSGFLPNGTTCVKNHRWMSAGKYLLRVTASDNQSSAWSEEIIWIDALPLEDLGYLLDTNGDGLFDAFHDNASGSKTTVEMRDGAYLIDADGNQVWDHEFNITNGILTVRYQFNFNDEEQSIFPWLWVGGIAVLFFAILIVIYYLRKFMRKSNRK